MYIIVRILHLLAFYGLCLLPSAFAGQEEISAISFGPVVLAENRLPLGPKDLNIKTVFVLGPATQDCLKHTILDACQLGLQVVVLKDATGSLDHSTESLNEISLADAIQATASDLGISPA